MLRWMIVGTLFQLAMVLVGHQVAAVASLFGPLGVAISLGAGLGWAWQEAEGPSHGTGGGALVGGVCAFLGIVVSWLLGDVTAVILLFGTASSAVTGALGGLGGGLRRRSAARSRAALPLVVLGAVMGAFMTSPAPALAQEVTVEDFRWMAGEWEGAGPGGSTAEIDYMPPRGGVLPALFRLTQGERVVVLEAVTLVDEEDGLFMYVRHFDPALVPLEKERAIRLHLIRRDGEKFYFENVNEGQNPVRSTMTRTPSGFESRSILARDDGTTDEIRVEYRRR